MSDYGDTSGGNSDQAIRDIVAQLQGVPQTAAPQAAPVGVMPAPEVTPTMLQGTGANAATPGAPLSLVPVPAVAPRAKPDDWSPPVPVMTPPPVTPLGQLAAVPRPTVAPMGGVLMVRR